MRAFEGGLISAAEAREVVRASLRRSAAAEIAELAKSISDPNRVRLLDLLDQHQLCPTDLAGMTGIELSVVSHHLKKARDAGLVDWWPVAVEVKNREYLLTAKGEEALQAMRSLIAEGR